MKIDQTQWTRTQLILNICSFMLPCLYTKPRLYCLLKILFTMQCIHYHPPKQMKSTVSLLFVAINLAKRVSEVAETGAQSNCLGNKLSVVLPEDDPLILACSITAYFSPWIFQVRMTGKRARTWDFLTELYHECDMASKLKLFVRDICCQIWLQITHLLQSNSAKDHNKEARDQLTCKHLVLFSKGMPRCYSVSNVVTNKEEQCVCSSLSILGWCLQSCGMNMYLFCDVRACIIPWRQVWKMNVKKQEQSRTRNGRRVQGFPLHRTNINISHKNQRIFFLLSDTQITKGTKRD